MKHLRPATRSLPVSGNAIDSFFGALGDLTDNIYCRLVPNSSKEKCEETGFFEDWF